MAKKGKIPITAAADISRKYGCPVVIVFGIDANGETLHLTSYGKSKSLCKHAASLAEQIEKKIFAGEIAPANTATWR
jgi:hypothetical protein